MFWSQQNESLLTGLTWCLRIKYYNICVFKVQSVTIFVPTVKQIHERKWGWKTSIQIHIFDLIYAACINTHTHTQIFKNAKMVSSS